MKINLFQFKNKYLILIFTQTNWAIYGRFVSRCTVIKIVMILSLVLVTCMNLGGNSLTPFTLIFTLTVVSKLALCGLEAFTIRV